MRWWGKKHRNTTEDERAEPGDPTRGGYDPRISGRSRFVRSGSGLPRRERERYFKEIGYK
jgi:hypothetical protein